MLLLLYIRNQIFLAFVHLRLARANNTKANEKRIYANTADN
jgi:hypothetical protein